MRPARLWLGGLGTAALVAAAAGGISAALSSDDVIVLGAADSINGKYAQNGANTKNGYDLAIRETIKAGGVKVGGMTDTLSIRYYDD